MKREYDFSKGERGKFYRPGVELNIPVYLEPDVAKLVRQRATRRDATIAEVVNELLRKEIHSQKQDPQKLRCGSRICPVVRGAS